jgi:hypothetical protein
MGKRAVKENRNIAGGDENRLLNEIKSILKSARSNAYRAVNSVMVEAYWNVGRRIVEEEQKGGKRAGYGERLIQKLAEKLKNEAGGGYSAQTLWNMRQFYSMFPILSALRRELMWTHYRALIRVENKTAREFYTAEASLGNWSSRVLERQIHSFYYERLVSSRNRKPVKAEAAELTHQDIGQMDMYVRMYEKKVKNKGDNPTIGIIMCADKDETVVKYSVMKDNKKLFASRYKLYLPTEEELKQEIKKERDDFLLEEERAKYGL